MTLAFNHSTAGPEWTARLRQGDEAAFEALFHAFAPGLVAFVARTVRSRAIAEELVQDLFLTVWRRRTELDVDSAITTYLYAAARNRALDYLARERTAQRWRDTEARAAGGLRAAPRQRAGREARPSTDAPDPSAPIEEELLDVLEVQDAIGRLPPRCRLVFTLSRQHEMTYTEIAQTLGLSIKTVETQMGRALKALRARLAHLMR